MTSCGVVSLSAAKMPPVCSQRTPSLAEDVVPIEIAGLELAGGGMAAVGNAHRAAHAETALGEIQPVAHRAAHAVERHPLDEFRVHAALQNKILDEPADVVVGERGADGGLEAEAAAQAAGDVVFAAAFPGLEFAGRADAALARDRAGA